MEDHSINIDFSNEAGYDIEVVGKGPLNNFRTYPARVALYFDDGPTSLRVILSEGQARVLLHRLTKALEG